jgi:ABC-type transport system involved in multi-copper enzyme maturation permease subunit
MPTALFCIARNAFTESIRQPIYVVLLLGIQALLVFNVCIAAFTFLDDDKLLTDLGLSTMLLAGLFMAAFTATGVFSREIQNKTVLTVISKPVSRTIFVLGKYLGVLLALTVAYIVWAVVFLLTIRHQVLVAAWMEIDLPVVLFGSLALLIALGVALWTNYFYGWVFASTLTLVECPLMVLAYLLVLCVGKDWSLQSPMTDLKGQLLITLFLLSQAVAILSAVALATSVRLGQTMTLTISTAFFFLGLSSDYLFGRFADGSWLAMCAQALLPNLQLFWMADALTQNHPIGLDYVMFATGYAAFYTAAVLGVAVALFQTREVG